MRETSDWCKNFVFLNRSWVGFLSMKLFLKEFNKFSLETIRINFLKPCSSETLVMSKYLVSLLKIMADISKMGNMYKKFDTEFGALVSSIKLSFFSEGKRNEKHLVMTTALSLHQSQRKGRRWQDL